MSETLTISFVLGASLSSVAKASDKNCSEIADADANSQMPDAPLTHVRNLARDTLQ